MTNSYPGRLVVVPADYAGLLTPRHSNDAQQNSSVITAMTTDNMLKSLGTVCRRDITLVR